MFSKNQASNNNEVPGKIIAQNQSNVLLEKLSLANYNTMCWIRNYVLEQTNKGLKCFQPSGLF